jgi:hypothetical protein
MSGLGVISELRVVRFGPSVPGGGKFDGLLK